MGGGSVCVGGRVMPGHYDQLYWNGLSQENTLLSCFQVKMNLAHVLQSHHHLERVALTKNALTHACAQTHTYSVSSSISVHIVSLSSVTPAVNYQIGVLALLRPPPIKPLTRAEWQEFNSTNNNPQIKQNTDRCLRLCLPVHGLCYTHTLLSFCPEGLELFLHPLTFPNGNQLCSACEECYQG